MLNDSELIEDLRNKIAELEEEKRQWKVAFDKLREKYDITYKHYLDLVDAVSDQSMEMSELKERMETVCRAIKIVKEQEE